VSKLFSVGGYVAAAVLIVLGVGVIVVGVVGRSAVQDQLADEQIVGSDDMTPSKIQAGIEEAGLENVSAPSCSVAGEKVDTGQEAKCFADYMRIHTLESTGGKTYAQMPQFATKDGAGTNDAAQAQKNPDGSPMSNSARQIWVTETALTTALYTSFFAESVALFAIIVGIALLLVGIGFLVLTVFARRRTPDATAAEPRTGVAT
jgi:F0F1-type ATP synthase membrane subunit c/vacuolar-type H+-ATPase subunit K